MVSRSLYRFVRNPMYIGVLFVITGEAILFASWPIAMYALSAALAFHLFVLLYEEPTLRSKFGPAYEEYLRSVPRWIPRFQKARFDQDGE
jgi:protein-S-isoprenylcysteine O-methyltransferase Ste14